MIDIKKTAKDLLKKAKGGTGAIKDYTYVTASKIKNLARYPKLVKVARLNEEMKDVPQARRKKYLEVGNLLRDKKITVNEGGKLYQLLRADKDVLLEPYSIRINRNTKNFNWSPWQTKRNFEKYSNIPKPKSLFKKK